jgi:hypothetical protein
MINYQFEILELDASEGVAAQQPGEVIEEYQARVDDALGKNFFRLTVVDVNKMKQTAVFSPYFVPEEQPRDTALFQLFREVKKMIHKRTPVEPTLIIVP